MKGASSIGIIVLALWLIVQGIVDLFQINIPSLTFILPIIAILSGVLLMLRARDPKTVINLGYLLLSVWLILTGLLPLFGISSAQLVIVMAVLGAVAGVLLLVGQ